MSDLHDIDKSLIAKEVVKVISEEAIEEWFDTYIPAMGMTGREALEAKPEELLLYVKSYNDPSYG